MTPDSLAQALTAAALSSEQRARITAAMEALGAWSWPLKEATLAADVGRALARGRADVVWEDLLLASGVMAGVDAAWREFERRCRPVVRAAMTKALPGPSAEDEAQRLFTAFADPERSLLETYAGDGPLVGWVSVVATRRAWKAARATRPEEVLGDDALLERVADGQRDPALEVFKATHADTFRTCIKGAFARLTAKERNLLRLHHLDGVQTAELARLHGVHRATVVRWLADARLSFVSNFRDEFAARLGASRLEVDSLARVFRSGLDISLPMESMDVASRGD